MKWTQLNKIFMLISNWKVTLVSMAYKKNVSTLRVKGSSPVLDTGSFGGGGELFVLWLKNSK